MKTVLKVGMTGVLVALLNGCAVKTVWYKPGGTPEEFQRDYAECKYEAVKHTPPYYGQGNPVAVGIGDAIHQQDIIAAGMRAKGYRAISREEAKKLGLEVTPAR